jgi:hypothetical protein
MVIVFVIIGKGDCALYHAEYPSDIKTDDATKLDQFLIHAALDSVDDLVWQSNGLFLKTVDSSDSSTIMAYVTPGNA